MSFSKAGRSDLVPPSHRKRAPRKDKGKRRVPKVRKIRKDAGKLKLPKQLLPAAALPNRGGGPLSQVEHVAVEALIASVRGDEPEQELQTRGRALALALGRTPAAIRKAVVSARERLQESAGTYAELHLEAARVAAREGDAKPAEWALERITAPTEDGKGLERVVEPIKGAGQVQTMPVVNIGIGLGGIAPGAKLTPQVEIQRIPVAAIEGKLIDVEDEP